MRITKIKAAEQTQRAERAESSEARLKTLLESLTVKGDSAP